MKIKRKNVLLTDVLQRQERNGL